MRNAMELFRRERGEPFRALAVEAEAEETRAAGMDASLRVCRLFVPAGCALRQGERIRRARDGRVFRVTAPPARPPQMAERVPAAALCEEVTDA